MRTLSIFLFVLFISCETRKAWIDKERIVKAASEAENWITLGGNYQMQHYSPLSNINTKNVMF